MEFKPWMKDLTPDDMPNEDLRTLAEELGVETALKVIDAWGGLSINIPRNPFRIFIINYILKNYDGTRSSMIQLTKDCDVTDKYIYRLFKKKI